MKLGLATVAFAGALALGGCGETNGSQASDDDDDSAGDEAADDQSDGGSSDDGSGSEAPAASCETEMRDDTYAIGLAKDGAALRVTFVDAMPAPPARYDNAWIVMVTDAATGEPVADCLGEAIPFMPDHMHGTSIEAHVTAGENPGEYVIDPVNLFMPGLWEVTLEFTCGEVSDDVVFSFCVDP